MKAGRSIVATDIPSNRLILDESNAVLTEPVPEAFARGIISLVEDEQHRQKIGDKNYELYQTKYNFDCYCKLMNSCYLAVLEKESNSKSIKKLEGNTINNNCFHGWLVE
jgi:glycosyltransferase involved in cell wall biosynthesis